ncbi:uncharacterized protein LOC136064456 [Quercus suber]|uniref:uncharacterized protein LOC136064456 n=1 Tax=Quercus suber TaxID=58331 RepID=UPI000D2E1674|nr:hypothetical protein CFP56_13691 [Quercus suber]
MNSQRREINEMRDRKNIGYHVGRVKTLAVKRTKRIMSAKKLICRCNLYSSLEYCTNSNTLTTSDSFHNNLEHTLSMIWSGEDRSSLIAFHQPFVFLITLLATLVGLHFQVLDISPLKTHFTITLLLVMAAILFSIAYAEINVQPHNSDYLPLFRLTYVGSGILTCELLVGLLMSPFWWFMVNLCTILTVEILRYWHQLIYQFVCQSRDWLQQKFEAARLAAFEAFSLTRDTAEQQNGGNRPPV